MDSGDKTFVILQTGMSYHIILMYYLNYEHTCCAKSVTVFCTLLLLSLFPYSD